MKTTWWSGEGWRYQCESPGPGSIICKPIFDQRADGMGKFDPSPIVSRDPSAVKSWKGGRGDVLDPSNVAPVKIKDIVSVDVDVEVYGCQSSDLLALYFFDAHKAKGNYGYTSHWDAAREADLLETMGTCFPNGWEVVLMHNWDSHGASGGTTLKEQNSATEDLFVMSGTKENPTQKHLSFTQKRGGGSTTWDSYGCDQDKVTTSGQCPKSGDGTPGWSHVSGVMLNALLLLTKSAAM